MNRFCRTVFGLVLLLALGCRIEDHTPTGSRRDEDAVQALVSRYARTLSERDWAGARALYWSDATYSGPLLPPSGEGHQSVPIDFALAAIARRVQGLDPAKFDVRVLRSDYRQDGDLAAVWLTTRRLLPVAGSVVDGEWIEHLVLRRIDGEWRILSVASTLSPRGKRVSSADLALVGSVAKLLNEGLGAEATLAAVAETLRRGLPAEAVAVWAREPGTTAFRAVQAPPAPDAPRLVRSLDALPSRPRWRRFALEHEATKLGLLEAKVGDGAAEHEVLAIVADFLAPYLAAAELSADLAGEVAAQSREIDEHRRFTSLIVDSLPLGLYVVDRDYRIQSWNRKRETGTQGLRRDDVVGRPVFEVLTRQPAAELRAEFDRVFETGEIQQAEHEVTLAGEPRFFRLSKIPMRLDGDEITHVITIGEDVTEWRRVQGQIMQSEKLAAIGQLAAGVMHEINNPLATIGACVAAIEGRLPAAGAEVGAVGEYLEIIDREVDRCTRIVDGLLDFSRPRATPKQSLSLNTLVDETLFLLKHHERFKRLEVVRALAPDLPDTVGSQEQLIQVLMALMLNALDAMEHGGQLTVRTAASPARPAEVIVEVEDTGVGIPRADRTKIFEPFYTTKPPGRGTGLGLSICYGIVADHRGRIEVDSAPGRGTVFRVFLPVPA